MASSTSKAFDMGKLAIGGIGQVLDSVEFVKRAWSTLSMPSPLVPTMDIDELDKRIADLKAVEQWLNVNLSMLHGTIQGLEIQRGTLAAVKAFGASLGTMAQAAEPRGATPSRSAPRATPKAAAEKPAQPASPPPSAPESESVESPSLPGIQPTAWWNLLQQNFNQVAQAALSGGGLQEAAVTAMKAAGDLAGAAMPKPMPSTAAKARTASPRKPAVKAASAAGGRRAPARKARKAAS